jgi:hypothetical protein
MRPRPGRTERRPSKKEDSISFLLILNISAVSLSNVATMKKKIKAALLLPTLVCAWCKEVMRPGAAKISHGICRPCALRWFGKFRPVRPLPA